jgi:hypothetical protein
MIDFGHILIGLDARSREESRTKEVFDPSTTANPFETDLSMGGTGLELVTWVGDLGAAASKLAELRLSNPGTPASRVFPLDGSSHGAAVNIEGDVAAYVIASGKPIEGMIPSIQSEVERGLSGALIDYLGPQNITETWSGRAKAFLTFYGGKFDNANKLRNSDQVLAIFESKIQKFAFYYKETRLKDEAIREAERRNIDLDETMIDNYVNLVGSLTPKASRDVATLFIQILEKGVIRPEMPLSP